MVGAAYNQIQTYKQEIVDTSRDIFEIDCYTVELIY